MIKALAIGCGALTLAGLLALLLRQRWVFTAVRLRLEEEVKAWREEFRNP